jgi:hypothetical protein
MKILKKVLASTLALFISASFAFGGFAKEGVLDIPTAYADSAVEAQRDQLKLALADATYVRSTQSYQNAAKKDVDLYEQSLTAGQAIVDDPNATGQDLFNATKNIDLNRKYLPTSANIVLIKAAIEKSERKLQGINYLEKNMPNSVKRYRKIIDQAKQQSLKAINEAKAYVRNNER